MPKLTLNSTPSTGADGIDATFGRQQDQVAAPGQGEQEQAPSVFGGKEPVQDFGPDYSRRVRIFKSNEVNPYADEQDERYGFDPRFTKVVLLVLLTVVVFVFTATFPTGALDIINHGWYSPAQFLELYRYSLAGFADFLTGGSSFYALFVWQMVAALLAGAAMGLSGGVYQGALKNALASPSTLGVTSGASLGLIIYALFGYTELGIMSVDEYTAYLETLNPLEVLLQSWAPFLCSLVGCFAVVAMAVLIAHIAGRGHVSNVSLVIAGQVFTSVIGVVVMVVQYYVIYELHNSTLNTLIENSYTTTFAGAYTFSSVLVFAVPLIACMVGIFCMSNRLNLLAFNEDEARSMGISTTRTRNLMVGLCTVMTALVVSFTGPVGFVGFMVPHIARRIIGPEFRYLLPATAALGAILVLLANWVANMGIPGIETGSAGVFTSVVGCVFFLITAFKTKGEKRAEWY
ncbi:MAG: FecCD family ABC transporter permease [Coriobacteriales bacterium]